MQVNDKKLTVFIAILAFAYMFFFTQSLPIFWEGHQFHEGFAKQSVGSLIKQTFSFSGNILEKNLHAYGLFFKTLFYFFNYNFWWYRIAKAVVFIISIILMFKLCQKIFIKKEYATITTALFTTSFPIYIQTMVFDEPFIIAEMFKFAAIIIFLKDIWQEKTNYARQFFVFLFSLLAYKTYPPSAAVIGLLVLFTFQCHRRKLRQYFVLFTLLFIMIFPFSSFSTGKTTGPFGIHKENIKEILFYDITSNILSPMHAIDFSEYAFRPLYWKSLPNILTFFWFWTLALASLIIFFNKTIINYLQIELPQKEQSFKIKFKEIFWFCIIWIICELPVIISVPEPAIRYTSAMIPPLMILFVSYITRAQNSLSTKKTHLLKYFFYFAVIFIVFTNITNTVLFRALLGSDVIAMDKVIQIIEKNEKSCIIYVPTYVADQYLTPDKTNHYYNLRSDIKRMPSTTKEQFQEANFKEQKQKCSRLFVVQQKSITRGTLFPPIDFSKINGMKIVQHIIGQDDTLFDKTYFFIRKIFNTRNLYNEYYLWEYTDAKQKSSEI